MAGLGGFGCGLTIGFGRFVGWGLAAAWESFNRLKLFFLESAWYCCFCVWVGEGDVGRLFMHGTIWVDLCYFAKRASSVLCITEIYSRNDKSSTKSSTLIYSNSLSDDGKCRSCECAYEPSAQSVLPVL